MSHAEGCAAALRVVRAVAETIRELKVVPSGHLYAAVMSKMDLRQYEAVIDTLVSCGLVERRPNHLLAWIEPQK